MKRDDEPLSYLSPVTRSGVLGLSGAPPAAPILLCAPRPIASVPNTFILRTPMFYAELTSSTPPGTLEWRDPVIAEEPLDSDAVLFRLTPQFRRI